MSRHGPVEPQPKPARWMTVLGGVLLAGFACYALFMAIDGIALATHVVPARVVEKHYREPGTTYATQVIGGAVRTLPRVTDEQFLVLLDVDGSETLAAVSGPTYRALTPGDNVQATCQWRRLTGTIQVLDLTLNSHAR